jgi:hypothetical protein
MTDDIEFVDGQKYVVIYVGKWYDNECFDYSKIFIQSDDNIVVAYQALFESSYIVTLIPKTLTKLKLDCKSIQ